jgi:hypothetical protein
MSLPTTFADVVKALTALRDAVAIRDGRGVFVLLAAIDDTLFCFKQRDNLDPPRLIALDDLEELVERMLTSCQLHAVLRDGAGHARLVEQLDGIVKRLKTTTKRGRPKRNDARDAWIARRRDSKTKPTWQDVFRELVKVAARHSWQVPGDARGVREAYYRRVANQAREERQKGRG